MHLVPKLSPVIQRSVKKADPEKKIKLDKEAISEILVADTDSESSSEASDFDDFF